MRSPLSAAALAATVLLVAVPAGARDRDYRDRETSERDTIITPNQIIDMADARVAQFKADLRLNPDQDRNWSALQNALHDMALRRADRMTKARERAAAAVTAPAPGAPTAPPAKDVTATPPAGTDASAQTADQRDRDTRDARDRSDRDRSPDIVAVMRRQAEMLTDRADDYRKFADASGPLYGSLDDGQKRRFLAFVQRNLMEEPEGPAYRR